MRHYIRLNIWLRVLQPQPLCRHCQRLVCCLSTWVWSELVVGLVLSQTHRAIFPTELQLNIHSRHTGLVRPKRAVIHIQRFSVSVHELVSTIYHCPLLFVHSMGRRHHLVVALLVRFSSFRWLLIVGKACGLTLRSNKHVFVPSATALVVTKIRIFPGNFRIIPFPHCTLRTWEVVQPLLDQPRRHCHVL